MPRIAVFLVEGFEEVEAVTPVDYLRRAGVDVVTVGVEGLLCIGARGIPIQADVNLEDLHEPLDGCVLPGGLPGAENLGRHPGVEALCRKLNKQGKLVAAICAAPPLTLGRWGLLRGKAFTCYPGFEDRVPDGLHQKSDVVIDGNLVTSRGAGTAGLFAYTLIDRLMDSSTADRIASTVLLDLPL